MRGQPGFFDVDDRLQRLSDLGDQLETFLYLTVQRALRFLCRSLAGLAFQFAGIRPCLITVVARLPSVRGAEHCI